MAFNKSAALKNNNEALKIILNSSHNRISEYTPEQIDILNNYTGFGAIKEILLPINDKSAWNTTDLKLFDDITETHNIIKEYGAKKATDYPKNPQNETYQIWENKIVSYLQDAFMCSNEIEAKSILRDLKENQIQEAYEQGLKNEDVFDFIFDARNNEKKYKNFISDLRNNTLSAFYTPDSVCNSIVEVLHEKGFNIKEALEPSAGSGKFINAITQNYPNANVTAIEKDTITAAVLKANQSHNSNVFTKCKGFETEQATGSYDLVMSNIPFGSFSVSDADYLKEIGPKRNSTQRIHNYFFVKGIDHLKNDGVLAYITTSSFTDSENNKEFRNHLVKNADLLDIVRLPNDLFKNNSGTEVGTDLIILKKNANKSDLSELEKKFVETIELNNININQVFEKNGTLDESRIISKTNSIGTNQYGKPSYIHTYGNDMDELALNLKNHLQNSLELNSAISKNNEIKNKNNAPVQGSLFSTEEIVEKNTIELANINSWYINGIVSIHDDKLVQLSNINTKNNTVIFNEIPDINIYDTRLLKDYVELRESFFTLQEKELSTQVEQTLLRNQLNTQYEAFQKKYGLLHDNKSKNLLHICPQYSKVVGSLERRTLQNNNNVYVKGDILLKPLVKATVENKIYDVNEALAITLNRYGRVNYQYMMELTKLSQEKFYNESKNLIYFNPEVKEWETADEFLSGKVVAKKEYFEKNYTPQELKYGKALLVHTYNAICAVQPQKIPFELLDINMGERWIDKEIYQEFAQKLFNDASLQIKYSPTLDKYEIKSTDKSYNPIISEEYAVKSESGTIRGLNLFTYALHNITPDLTKNIGTSSKPIRVVDNKAIQECGTKIDKIRDKFVDYLNTLPKETLDKFTNQYNYIYNNTVIRKHNGSHLQFADIQEFVPRDYQKNAAWRIMQDNGGIIDHPPGAGKTLTMCMTAHEMKRLGFAKKPAIIGLKANISQIADEYRKAYPHDKILFPSKEDIEKDNRVEFFQQMQNQDWDCIIMTHEQFEKIPQSRAIQEEQLKDAIESIESDLYELRASGSDVSKQMLKGLEIRKNNKQTQLNNLFARIDKDNRIVDFETIGIDHIFVDESQKFKNLEFTTRHDRVAGLGNQLGSQRSLNLLTAIRTLQKKSGKDLGATFLSGTTISNSLTEMFTLFKYLRPKMLEEKFISNFDSWAAVFTQKSTEYEFNITNELQMKERFRTFVKVPELSAMYNEITDFKTFEDLKLDRPTEEVELIVNKQTPEQKIYAKQLIGFAKTGNAELIGRQPLGEKEKNSKMLIATNYAKKMAMDMRLINPDKFEDSPDNKISQCCKNIHEYYKSSQEQKGTQAVFLDMGTPGTLGFNLYNAFKEKLINEYGIPEREIAFIHSANSDKQRNSLFKKVNNGEVRIILGSTEKMGTGVNMQERMVTMHDVDIPWRPSDLMQRHGRGARKGNWVAKQHYNNKVKTFVYATEGTLDVYKFNLLKNKQQFIDQIKNNTISSRRVDEGSMEESSGMSFAEYVAVLSGNTDLLDKAKIDNQIAKIEAEKGMFFRDFNSTSQNYAHSLHEIKSAEKFLTTITADKKIFDSKVKVEKGTRVNALILNGEDLSKEEPINVGFKILQSYKSNESTQPKQIGELYGFKCYVQKSGLPATNRMYVASQDGSIKYMFANGYPNEDSLTSAARYFMNSINKMDSLIEFYNKTIKENTALLPVYKEILKAEWSQDKEAKLQDLYKQSAAIDEKIKEAINMENQKVEDSKVSAAASLNEEVTVSVVAEPPGKYTNGIEL